MHTYINTNQESDLVFISTGFPLARVTKGERGECSGLTLYCLYFYLACLYPFKIQVCCPGHTPRLSRKRVC